MRSDKPKEIVTWYPHSEFCRLIQGQNHTDLIMTVCRLMLTGAALLCLFVSPSFQRTVVCQGKLSALERLMGGESLLIKLQNVEYGENIYAEYNGYGKDATHRTVHTWRPVKDVGDIHNWNVTGVFIDGKFRVRLTHITQAGEKLMSPPEKTYMFDTERRPVYTWIGNSSMPTESADWYMETDIGNTESLNMDRYRFTNVLTKEYLVTGPDSTAYDKDRRRVFTLAGDRNSLAGKNHLWDVLVLQ